MPSNVELPDEELQNAHRSTGNLINEALLSQETDNDRLHEQQRQLHHNDLNFDGV